MAVLISKDCYTEDGFDEMYDDEMQKATVLDQFDRLGVRNRLQNAVEELLDPSTSISLLHRRDEMKTATLNLSFASFQ